MQQLGLQSSISWQIVPSWNCAPSIVSQLDCEVCSEHPSFFSQHPVWLHVGLLEQLVSVYPSAHCAWEVTSVQDSPFWVFAQQLAETFSLEKLSEIKMLRVTTKKISRLAFIFKKLSL